MIKKGHARNEVKTCNGGGGSLKTEENKTSEYKKSRQAKVDQTRPAYLKARWRIYIYIYIYI